MEKLCEKIVTKTKRKQLKNEIKTTAFKKNRLEILKIEKKIYQDVLRKLNITRLKTL